MEAKEYVWQQKLEGGVWELVSPLPTGVEVTVTPVRKRGHLTGYKIQRTIKEGRVGREGPAFPAPDMPL